MLRFLTPQKLFSRRLSISGGQVIIKELEKLNVDTIFGYSGGAIMPLIDPLWEHEKIKLIINTHEQNTVHSATGYAKSSGKPGIVFVTSGPGLTNSITPMLDAHNDSTPLIVFSGNVPIKYMGTQAFQECPSVEMTKTFTKWSKCVKNIEELPYIIQKSWNLAINGKQGCVHIDIPKCISTTQTNFFWKNFSNNLLKDSVEDTKFKKLAKLINNSEKPIIIIGKGANNYPRDIYNFVVKSNIPITSTIHAVGLFPEKHPLSLKWLGMHGSACANFAVSESDLIINIGSRFDDRTTGNPEKYGLKARQAYLEDRGGIVHVNIEASEINKNIKSHFNFTMDSKVFLDKIISLVKYRERNNWISKINYWKNEYPFKIYEPNNYYINTQMVVRCINKYLQKDEEHKWKICTGVGNHQMYTAQFIEFNTPKSLITSGSLGVMGSGIGYAIGSQISCSGYKIILIDGDGSFNMTLPELQTIMKYNLPIKIAIMNDNQLSMVKAWEKLFFNKRYVATELNHNPNYTNLAKSYGIKALKCNSKHNLDRIVKEFLEYPGPILCEFKTISDVCYPLVPPGNSLDQMLFSKNHSNLNKNEVPS